MNSYELHFWYNSLHRFSWAVQEFMQIVGSKTVLMAHNLQRISYSVADPNDGLLAFVARSPVTSSAPAQTYCHAFVFDNRREAAEINTTLGNAFRLSFYKRTYKRPNMTGSGADKAQSHHTHSSSSTGTTDRSPVDLRTALKDTDLKSRIENWLDGSATPPPRSSNQRWKRSGSCEPHSIPERQMENLRRPSRVVTDQMAIPPEIKDQFWFQGGIPRHIALECLLHECEGAFIVRMSQTQKGCYALSLRGANGTYHYLIYRSNEGFYFPDDPDSSDFEEEIEDPDYEQPPEDGFTTLLPSKHAKPVMKHR
eukprot:sb/3467122/